MKTFAITTFGCQMNHSDSERVAAICKAMGYKEAQEGDEADLYVINTCSIRQKAEDRVMGMGKRFAKVKSQRSNVKTILTGCMAKRDLRQGKEKSEIFQEKYEGKLKKVMPWLDHVVEIDDIHHLPELLGEKVEEKVEDYLSIKPQYDSDFQAFVPISTGCNKFCTFCIVPFTRGKEVYRPFEEIYSEVKDLVERGYKEITLLGQNVNSWRSDNSLRTPITPLLETEYVLANSGSTQHKAKSEMQIANSALSHSPLASSQMDFADLMEALADIPGDFWLRFTSSHPYDINPRLVDVVAKKDKIAKQFHFALQSGSDSVLKRMNRFYKASEFKEKCLDIKSKIPDVGITTDVIVGFCGETEEEFADTANIVEELKFDQAFISEYSQREGTIAAKFYKDDVSNDVKAERKLRLDTILKKGLEENNEKLVGTIQKVLVYKEGIRNKKGVFGRTTQMKDVLIQKPSFSTQIPKEHQCHCGGSCGCHGHENDQHQSLKLGEFVNVKITGFKGFCLEGEVI